MLAECRSSVRVEDECADTRIDTIGRGRVAKWTLEIWKHLDEIVTHRTSRLPRDVDRDIQDAAARTTARMWA